MESSENIAEKVKTASENYIVMQQAVWNLISKFDIPYRGDKIRLNDLNISLSKQIEKK